MLFNLQNIYLIANDDIMRAFQNCMQNVISPFMEVYGIFYELKNRKFGYYRVFYKCAFYLESERERGRASELRRSVINTLK